MFKCIYINMIVTIVKTELHTLSGELVLICKLSQ